MKKWIAFLLTILLALPLAACTGEVPQNADDLSVQEGFGGIWYNSAGRKLELKSDGTYLLADEVEGGKWEKKSETDAECTDVYGTFSATYAKEDSEERLTFGPYGEFHRATEEELSRFEKGLNLPLHSVSFFHQGLAVSSQGKENAPATLAVINRDGLALSVPENAAFGRVEFFGDLLIFDKGITNFTTGKAVAVGQEIFQSGEEHVILIKNDSSRYGVVYAVYDKKGNAVVDWAPIERQGAEGEIPAFTEYVYVNHADGLLYHDTFAPGTDGRRTRIYYFFNPVSGEKFRVEAPENGDIDIRLESGPVFYATAEERYSFASDWTSPATPVELDSFRVTKEGKVEQVPPFQTSVRPQGDWFICIGSEETEGKTIVTNGITGETFSFNLPTEKMLIKITEHYCAVAYKTEEKGQHKLALFDLNGSPLCDPIEEPEFRVNGTPDTYSLGWKSFEDGTFFLYDEKEEDTVHVYNAKGERINTIQNDNFVSYCGDGIFFVEDRCLDAYGRVLIPHATFLTAE
ncbi:MAG: hypothetical protein J6M34_06185 [Clostridia bacterium]|nr:hypothetical protein [Clostridia bacterium]